MESERERLLGNSVVKPLRIGFAGDLVLTPEFAEREARLGRDPLDPLWQAVSLASDCDVVFLNLEGPLSMEGPARGGVSVRLSNVPGVADVLGQLRRCVCVLGNNHILDYGWEGLRETQEMLSARGIFWCGAGPNLDEALRPALVEVAGRRIACFSVASDEPEVGAVMATEAGAGSGTWRQPERLFERIRECRASVDCVVVQVHWGAEFYEWPSPAQVEFAARAREAGADLVMGHHSHVIEGREVGAGGAAYYGLGHLWVSPFRMTNGRWRAFKRSSREYLLACWDWAEGAARERVGSGWELRSGWWTRDGQMEPRTGYRKRFFERRVAGLSRGIGGKGYERRFRAYAHKRRQELFFERKWERLVQMVVGVG